MDADSIWFLSIWGGVLLMLLIQIIWEDHEAQKARQELLNYRKSRGR